MAGRGERSRELGSRIGFYRHGRRESFLSDELNWLIGQLGQGCGQRPGSCATASNVVASRAAGGARGELAQRQGGLVLGAIRWARGWFGLGHGTWPDGVRQCRRQGTGRGEVRKKKSGAKM